MKKRCLDDDTCPAARVCPVRWQNGVIAWRHARAGPPINPPLICLRHKFQARCRAARGRPRLLPDLTHSVPRNMLFPDNLLDRPTSDEILPLVTEQSYQRPSYPTTRLSKHDEQSAPSHSKWSHSRGARQLRSAFGVFESGESWCKILD